MNVKIESIPHDQQRYPTVGDWYFTEEGNLELKVSKLSDWRLEMLIAVHELIEVTLCKHNGVTQEQVDAFDIDFEKKREAGELEDPDAEPGDDPKAPYRDQHCFATGIERLLAAKLGVCWAEYEAELNKLP